METKGLIVACDAGLKRLHQGYGLDESKEIYSSLHFWQMVDAGFKSLVIVPIVMLRSFRMKKRWHWSDFDYYLHRSLKSIREEFGISLFRIG